MQGKKVFLLAALLFSMTSLAGCSGSVGSGGDKTVGGAVGTAAGFVAPVSTAITVGGGAAATTLAATTQVGGQGGSAARTSISVVGADKCIICHQGFSWSGEKTNDFLAGMHVIHSAYIDQTKARANGCGVCHDPIGDGPTLASLLNPADIPAGGLAAVTCEVCHGAGGEHWGVGPIPSPNPDFKACGQCHNEGFDHNSHHPLADNLVENYQLGPHFTSIERAHGTPEELDAKCSRCHSDEGFRTFYPQTMGLGRDGLSALLDAAPPLTDIGPVQCRTCHDPHSGELRTPATVIEVDVEDEQVEMTAFSASFNLCTACHLVWLDVAWDEAAGRFVYTYDWDKVLADEDADGRNNHYHGAMLDMVHSHFDDPTTAEIEGFNIDAASESACVNCHDPHGATKFEQTYAAGIAAEWANEPGFHGDAHGPAFDHGCSPCHSPLGLIELTAGAEYEEGDTEAGVIGCVACHDLQARNATNDGFALGPRRTLAEFAFDNARTLHARALETDPDAVLETIAGLGDNALCLTCHSGRESTASVDAKIAASEGPYSFTNVHYLAAGATLFGNMAKGAYEYEGKAYASKFEHVESNDLCVECHNAHSGELYLISPGFGPTGCDACHAGIVVTGDYEADVAAVRDIRMAGSLADYDGDGNAAEGLYHEVVDLIDLLEATLLADGVMYVPASYPYFFPVDTTEFTRANAAPLTAAQLRAAYNLQFASKDPGAYAHNGTYIIEILYDSIEALGGDVSGLTRDAAGHFDAAGEPFRHWDGDETMSTTCGRCHSSEGAAAFFTNGTVTAEDFKPYTRGISAGLACEACHLPDTTAADLAFDGIARPVTSVTFPSGEELDATNAAAFFADASPLCMSCHQGRESGLSVTGATAGNDGTFRFVNIHYYAAAASLFGSEVKGGYEYEGKTYAGRNTFPAHAVMGLPFTTCAGCHMNGSPTHDFKPNVTSCTGCHGGTSFETLGFSPSTNFNNIQTLKEELATALTASGVTILPGYPYFGNITTSQQLRAAYNWQMADKEPAGYMHNGKYIKQLLYDSIVDLGGAPSVARP